MSIRRRVEDARLLMANGRVEGALLSACAAISATSRRRYDQSSMKDRKAFTTFLAEEIRVVTAGGVTNFHVRCPGADPKYFPNGMMPLQDVLYDFVRCKLAHEGRMGENVEFIDTDELSVEVKDDRLIFGGEAFRRLLVVSEYAPENMAEFPEVTGLPPEVIEWDLFGERRAAHAAYLAARQRRLEAIQRAVN